MRFIIILSIFTIITSLVISAQPDVPPPTETIYTPDSSMQFAVADLNSIPPTLQPFMRYLSLYNIPKLQRKSIGRDVSFAIHSLSRRRKPHIPVFVGGSDETVIRINLRDYDIPRSAWDNLGRKGSGPKPFPEPYFHAFGQEETVFDQVLTKRTREVGTGKFVWQNGQKVEQKRIEQFDVIEKIPSGTARGISLTSAPWLDVKMVTTLYGATGSEFP